MRVIQANIKATFDYKVDELGQVYGKYGIVKGKAVKNSFTRVLDYCQQDNPHEITSITIPRLIFQSFNPEIILEKDDIIVIVNPNEQFIFALENLKVVKRKEHPKFNKLINPKK